MATISQAPATLDIVAVKGDDLTITLSVTESSVAYDWTGATVATQILDTSGTVLATNFTTSTPANGALVLSLTDTNTTAIGVGTFRYWVSVTKSSATRTWLAGAFTVMQAGWGGTSTSSASLSITTSSATVAISSVTGGTAAGISVVDTAGYFTSTNVESVLAELGGGWSNPTNGNRVVFLGDSITTAQGNDTNYQWGVSFPTYGTFFSMGKLQRIRNAGVVGNTTAQMLARFSTDVAAYLPSLVVICAGTNDWNDAVATPLATYATQIDQIVNLCRQIGAGPVLCTVPPNIGSSTRRSRTTAGNAWLRKYAQQHGIPLVDFYNLLVDPSTGGFLSTYNLDGTHPNNLGYAAMGSLLNSSLAAWLVPTVSLLPQENADPNNLLTNGLYLTTTGSGATLMPTGWTVQTGSHPTGVTGSTVTGDSTIKGNWWSVAASGASATNNEYQTVSGIVPGNVYAHVGRFKATSMREADSGSGSQFLIGNAYNSTLNNSLYDFRAATSLSYGVTEGVYCQISTAPSDASTCLVRRQLLNTTSGNGTLQVAQTGFYNLTAMGIA